MECSANKTNISAIIATSRSIPTAAFRIAAAILIFCAASESAQPAELSVTPECAALSGVLTLRCHLAGAPAECVLVVADAYRENVLLRTSRPMGNPGDDPTWLLSYTADPGTYAIRVEDSSGHVLAGPGYFFVPGITKRGSWWLFDGQPMCGAIRTWGGLDGEAEKLVEPLYKGGDGFNVLTLELHTDMLGGSDADPRRRAWPILQRNGAYSFIINGDMGWEGLSGPLAIDKKENEHGEPSGEGSFMSERNRHAVLDLMRRIRQDQFPDGRVSPAFLGFCMFENHLGFKPWYDYSKSALDAYRDDMKRRFGTIEAYNRASGTSWKTWEELDAPRDANSVRPDWITWTDDRFRSIAMYYQWLQPGMRQIFPGTYLFPVEGGMLATNQNDAGVAGCNAFEALDEREVAKVTDLIGTEGWADYTASHADLLLAATDPEQTNVPGMPIWTDYYTYLSVGPDIPRSLILKRVDQIGHGATGTLLEHVGAVYDDARKKDPAFLRHFDEAREVNLFLARYANLFIGAAQRPDVAVVTPTDTLKYGRDKPTVADADHTNAGIWHALTRLHFDKRVIYQDDFDAANAQRYPVVLATLGDLTSDRFLAEIERYVRGGGRVYLEGLPRHRPDNQLVDHRMDSLIGAVITPAQRMRSEMVCGDLRLMIERLATVSNLSADTRVVATFVDGSPAVLRRKVGLGEIFYAPNWVVRDTSAAYVQSLTDHRDKRFEFWAAFDMAYAGFYGRVLGQLGADAGVKITAPQADAIRTSRMLTVGGSTLLSIVNYGGEEDAEFELAGKGQCLRDLRSGQEIRCEHLRDRVRFSLHLPSSEWTFIALAKDESTLNEEIRKPISKFQETEQPR